MNDTHYVLTNYHVIDILGVKYCFINLQDNNEFFIGSYKLVLDPAYNFNSSSDSAFLEIGEWFLKSLDKSEFPKIPDLNYNASELKHCGTKMSIGTKVYTIGYPAFAKQTVDVFGEEGDIEARTLTQGTITGYDKASQIPFGNLPEVDYFVSAEIDSGNSGGLAVAETNRGLCLLGIPTWVVIGDFENQGVVQNIHNIFYED
jgi:S1-C subfamily serine protease